MARGTKDTKQGKARAVGPKGKATAPDSEKAVSKRSYLRQADVPILSLDDALRIPQALFDHYAGKPTGPLHIAKALSVDPKGSQMRLLSGAAIAFGLIEGGAQAASITPTDLARRIVRPKTENEDAEAKREAVLRPRVFREFLQQYDQSPFPRHDIALNVLEDMGVPRDKTQEVLERLDASARAVGFLEEINGKIYVSLQTPSGTRPGEVGVTGDVGGAAPPGISPVELDVAGAETATGRTVTTEARIEQARTLAAPLASPSASASMKVAVEDDLRRRRVFITHGKDRALVDPIRKLLEYGELEPVVSVERQSVSKPVPEKIMDDMRRCGAAIIHVDAERLLKDEKGEEHALLNPNVLIEIGAAMAFYGRRFILLVKEGVTLPSNLQGLYEVRYPADTLDAASTIKLLEAMKDIKNYELPGDRETDGG